MKTTYSAKIGYKTLQYGIGMQKNLKTENLF